MTACACRNYVTFWNGTVTDRSLQCFHSHSSWYKKYSFKWYKILRKTISYLEVHTKTCHEAERLKMPASATWFCANPNEQYKFCICQNGFSAFWASLAHNTHVEAVLIITNCCAKYVANYARHKTKEREQQHFCALASVGERFFGYFCIYTKVTRRRQDKEKSISKQSLGRNK